jgi:hypothetical protein
MAKRKWSVKVLFALVLIFIATNLTAQEFKLEKNDIKQFLAFADEYKALAKKILQNTDDMSISDIFYMDNHKMLIATNDFLKEKQWTHEKMNDFLYYVSCAMDAISFYDEYGYPAEIGEDESDPFKDIPQAVIALVKEQREALLTYFPITDFNLQDEEDAEAATATEDEMNVDALNYEDIPPDDMPPAAGKKMF